MPRTCFGLNLCVMLAWLSISSLGIAFLAGSGHAMSSDRDAEETEINRLIAQLGSPVYKTRENAAKSLTAIGERALEALSHASVNNSDGEIRVRAARLVSLIEKSRQVLCLKAHEKSIGNVVFLPDGRRALSASADCTMRLWDLETGTEVRRFQVKDWPFYRVAASRDGWYALSTSTDNTIRLWNIETGEEERRFEGKATKGAGAVSFASKDRYAVTSSDAITEHMVCLWDVKTGKQLRCFKDTPKYVYSLAVSGDDRHVLLGSANHTMTLWDLAKGEKVRTFVHKSGVFDVAFSPDGRQALSGSGNTPLSDPGTMPPPPTDCLMRLWDLDTGKEKRQFAGHTHSVTSVAFAPNGRRALSGSSDGTVRLWDLSSGRELCCFKGHEEQVTSVTFSPDGTRALSSGTDGTIRLWKIPK
jgi:WD40 repeat protein